MRRRFEISFTTQNFTGIYDHQHEAYEHLQLVKKQIRQVKDMDFHGTQHRVVVQRVKKGEKSIDDPVYMSEGSSDYYGKFKLWDESILRILRENRKREIEMNPLDWELPTSRKFSKNS